MTKISEFGRVITLCLLVGASASCEKETAKATPPALDELPAPAIEELVAVRVRTQIAKADPDAAFWRDVPRGTIELVAQPMTMPRPEKTTTESVVVQAVHDGKTIAFRLVWRDPEESAAGRLGEFSDAFALQFPSNGDASTPIMMGSPEAPVHIYHWRAQYQRDEEKGKPEMATLYPNMAVDMYAMDFKDAPGGTEAERESFSPARALGNPQAYRKRAVDEIVAHGFGTSAVQEDGSARGDRTAQGGGAAQGRAVWKSGRWALVITRPLAAPTRSALKVGGENYLAFAVWQGGLGEVGSRKSLTMAWFPMRLM